VKTITKNVKFAQLTLKQ